MPAAVMRWWRVGVTSHAPRASRRSLVRRLSSAEVAGGLYWANACTGRAPTCGFTSSASAPSSARRRARPCDARPSSSAMHVLLVGDPSSVTSTASHVQARFSGWGSADFYAGAGAGLLLRPGPARDSRPRLPRSEEGFARNRRSSSVRFGGELSAPFPLGGHREAPGYLDGGRAGVPRHF